MPEKKPEQKAKVKPIKEDDISLWNAAMGDVEKLQQKTINPPRSRKTVKEMGTPHIAPVSGTITLEILSPRKDYVTSTQIDKNLKKRLECGELPLDGRIDLHGLTLAEAHHRFINFMSHHIAEGSRTLLVITGKGAGGEGVIRKNLPLWCDTPLLRPHILQTAQAAARHGSTGATYILLRRQR